jgi:hypothetical protein
MRWEGVVQYLCQALSGPGSSQQIAIIHFFGFSLRVMATRCHSVNDDVPHAVLGVRTDETLSAHASVQEVDTSEPLPALDGIGANTTLELAEDLRLPGLAHGLVLGTLDGRAEVVVDGEQHVVDGDVGLAGRESGVGENVEHPGQVTHPKTQGGQRRAGGGRGEDRGRELRVVLGWGIAHVVLEAGRD